MQKVFCGFTQIFSVLRPSGRTSRVSLLIGYIDCCFFTIGLKIAGSVFYIEMVLKMTYFVVGMNGKCLIYSDVLLCESSVFVKK